MLSTGRVHLNRNYEGYRDSKKIRISTNQFRYMSPNGSPLKWTNPEYVATVVGVLATGTLVFYRSVTQSGPTVDEIVFIVLAITIPATIAYELARRFG